MSEESTADRRAEDRLWFDQLVARETRDSLPDVDPAEMRDRLSRLAFFDLVSILSVGGHDPMVGAELYRRWIELHADTSPMRHAAWFNLGVELSAAGDVRNAIVAYTNARVYKPDLHEAAINLGLMQESSGDVEAALQTWESALQPDEPRLLMLNHRGRLLERLERLDQAERVLRSSLLTDPHQPDVIQHWVHLRQKMCKWPVIAVQDVFALDAQRLAINGGPLTALALFDDIAVQRQIAKVWTHRKLSSSQERLSPEQGYRHSRIRVGYLSSDFRAHAMAFLVAELFERHDRDSFEVYGYCVSIDDGSEVRKRIIAAFDHFRSVRGLGDEAAARRIREDEIDILIDLNGLTHGARLGVLAWKPAPVQATYLGYIGPLPLPELDYILCDDYVIPRDMADAYEPAPLYIEGVYQANDTKRPIREGLTRTEVGLPPDKFVYCCFANHYKITEATFRLWLTILLQAPNSVLWLIADSAESQRNLTHYAESLGIDANRLIFAGRALPADYLARLRLADLYLDTHPYNAGTVASDALRVGLPLLTLEGKSFVARMAGSLLTAVGMSDLIAPTPQDYIALAVALATDSDRYRILRARLSEGAWMRTLGDVALFTRRFEAALRSVVKSPAEDVE